MSETGYPMGPPEEIFPGTFCPPPPPPPAPEVVPTNVIHYHFGPPGISPGELAEILASEEAVEAIDEFFGSKDKARRALHDLTAFSLRKSEGENGD